MRTSRVLLHMARADFLERSRSYSFLVILCLAIYLGYSINTGQIVLRFNTCAEIFDSAWVGVMMAIAINFFLGFFGFFLVKGSIERDSRTGVGQIMAATPLRRIEYTFGKWLSHLIVLSVLVVILAVATAVIQTLRGAGLDLATLLSPFFWLTLPFMALVAAVAVLFETVPWIKGGLSIVIYFLLFVLLLVTVTNPTSGSGVLTDPSGIRILLREIKSAGLDCGEKTSLNELANDSSPSVQSAGIAWSAEVALSRLGIFAAALSLTAASAFFFNRFDSSNEALRKARASKLLEKTIADDENITVQVGAPIHLTPLTGSQSHQNNLVRIVLAELRLMLKGNHPVWYVGAVFLWASTFMASQESITLWLTVAAIWPLLIWSKLGMREAYYRTNQIVFSCAHPSLRTLFASWLAGVLVTAAVWSGVGIHFALHNQTANLVGWLIAVLLVPTFALMLGAWTGSSKVFEVSYLVIWYAGIANRLPALDFIGLTPDSIVIQQPEWVCAFFIACLFLAFIGRSKRQYV